LQAHLSTDDYENAMNGLKRVRRFRYVTLWIKHPLDLFVHLVTCVLNTWRVRGINNRKVVVWSRDSTFKLSTGHAMVQIATDAQQLPFQEIVVQDAAVNKEIARGVL
jgi:hypothetical protein